MIDKPDWSEIRAMRMAPDSPSEWPTGVRAISIKGVNLLGIHEKSGKLYWDGTEIVTKSKIRLGKLEIWLVAFAAMGTFGTFVVELLLAGEKWGWWFAPNS